MKYPIVVMSFYGSNVKEFCAKHKKETLDCIKVSNFMYLPSNEEEFIPNPEWPANYIQYITMQILESTENDDVEYVMVPFNKDILEALITNKIPVCVLYPREDMRDSYVRRLAAEDNLISEYVDDQWYNILNSTTRMIRLGKDTGMVTYFRFNPQCADILGWYENSEPRTNRIMIEFGFSNILVNKTALSIRKYKDVWDSKKAERWMKPMS